MREKKKFFYFVIILCLFSIFLLINPTRADYGITDGSVVGLYHLEDVTDASGNSYNLTNNNGAVFDSGKLNNAIDFGSNNTSTYVSVANSLGIDGGNMSVSVWVNISAQPATNSQYDIVFQNNDTSKVGYQIAYLDSGGTKYVYFNAFGTML